jgi:hypothetical protein
MKSVLPRRKRLLICVMALFLYASRQREGITAGITRINTGIVVVPLTVQSGRLPLSWDQVTLQHATVGVEAKLIVWLWIQWKTSTKLNLAVDILHDNAVDSQVINMFHTELCMQGHPTSNRCLLQFVNASKCMDANALEPYTRRFKLLECHLATAHANDMIIHQDMDSLCHFNPFHWLKDKPIVIRSIFPKNIQTALNWVHPHSNMSMSDIMSRLDALDKNPNAEERTSFLARMHTEQVLEYSTIRHMLGFHASSFRKCNLSTTNYIQTFKNPELLTSAAFSGRVNQVLRLTQEARLIGEHSAGKPCDMPAANQALFNAGYLEESKWSVWNWDMKAFPCQHSRLAASTLKQCYGHISQLFKSFNGSSQALYDAFNLFYLFTPISFTSTMLEHIDSPSWWTLNLDEPVYPELPHPIVVNLDYLRQTHNSTNSVKGVFYLSCVTTNDEPYANPIWPVWDSPPLPWHLSSQVNNMFD